MAATAVVATGPSLSTRGSTRLAGLGVPDDLSRRFYDKERNPDGLINFSTAENTLMSPELLKFMNHNFHITVAHLKYRTALSAGFEPYSRDALARWLGKTLEPLKPIESSQVIVGPGIGGILAHTIWHLCDEGDGVLLTAPYYGDYPRDIIYPAKAVPVIVNIPTDVDSLGPGALSYIRDTIIQSRESGVNVKVLLLNNPHNPLARAYPVETIKGYAALAEEFNIHLLVDEVFGADVFPSKHSRHPTPFKSVLSLDLPSVDPSRIHVLAGPTKHFGASGIKVGALITQNNTDVLRAVESSLSATPISSVADAVFTVLLNDDKFVRWFDVENRKRLTKSFELLADWCDFHHLKYEHAEAGVYAVVDLAPTLKNGTIADAVKKMRDAGVVLKSTAPSKDPIPTRVRFIFTHPESLVKLGFSRIEKALGLPHWHGRH